MLPKNILKTAGLLLIIITAISCQKNPNAFNHTSALYYQVDSIRVNTDTGRFQSGPVYEYHFQIDDSTNLLIAFPKLYPDLGSTDCFNCYHPDPYRHIFGATECRVGVVHSYKTGKLKTAHNYGSAVTGRIHDTVISGIFSRAIAFDHLALQADTTLSFTDNISFNLPFYPGPFTQRFPVVLNGKSVSAQVVTGCWIYYGYEFDFLTNNVSMLQINIDHLPIATDTYNIRSSTSALFDNKADAVLFRGTVPYYQSQDSPTQRMTVTRVADNLYSAHLDSIKLFDIYQITFERVSGQDLFMSVPAQ